MSEGEKSEEDIPLLGLHEMKFSEAKDVTSLYLSNIRRMHNMAVRLPVSHEVSHVKELMEWQHIVVLSLMCVDVPGRDPL